MGAAGWKRKDRAVCAAGAGALNTWIALPAKLQTLALQPAFAPAKSCPVLCPS